MGLPKGLPALVSMFFVALLTAKTTEGCSCALTHPQTQFCEADFVMHVQVMDKTDTLDSRDTAYKVEMKKMFKVSNSSYQDLFKEYLYTSNLESTCGVSLHTGEEYVVSGQIYDEKWRLSLCNIVMPWKKVTQRQRRGYEGLYAKSCACKVRYTRFKDKGKVLNRGGGKLCLWEDRPGPLECQEKYGICMLIDSRCSWKPSKPYDRCIRKHQSGRRQLH
ncbi:tissue inhibitor of metalloproteinase [Copidosoma floridanum]|uniref:tissue inhibitor of metalloproteinase n=1 Tax=Copidosoma floridanum TaxID=29053 RepID=UPI0006C9D32E|nr:tissue inhibitor of metalloproteinase [Copidosoma floridanum]XP_014209330.1 tissue inhibitor of metalloproteinase [Copidosoma floridanum]